MLLDPEFSSAPWGRCLWSCSHPLVCFSTTSLNHPPTEGVSPGISTLVAPALISPWALLWVLHIGDLKDPHTPTRTGVATGVTIHSSKTCLTTCPFRVTLSSPEAPAAFLTPMLVTSVLPTMCVSCHKAFHCHVSTFFSHLPTHLSLIYFNLSHLSPGPWQASWFPSLQPQSTYWHQSCFPRTQGSSWHSVLKLKVGTCCLQDKIHITGLDSNSIMTLFQTACQAFLPS